MSELTGQIVALRDLLPPDRSVERAALRGARLGDALDLVEEFLAEQVLGVSTRHARVDLGWRGSSRAADGSMSARWRASSDAATST
jgi:hypothetical protein